MGLIGEISHIRHGLMKRVASQFRLLEHALNSIRPFSIHVLQFCYYTEIVCLFNIKIYI